jgi:hypothetical protein
MRYTFEQALVRHATYERLLIVLLLPCKSVQNR